MQRAGVKQWCLRPTFDVRIEVGRALKAAARSMEESRARISRILCDRSRIEGQTSSFFSKLCRVIRDCPWS